MGESVLWSENELEHFFLRTRIVLRLIMCVRSGSVDYLNYLDAFI